MHYTNSREDTFDSQEAFTRAFKNIYTLPPGRYRRGMRELIHDEGVMDMNNDREVIPSRLMTGSAPEKYEYGPDKEILFNGTRSVFLKSCGAVTEEGDFGTVMQQFKAAGYLGKRIRFSGFVKAADFPSRRSISHLRNRYLGHCRQVVNNFSKAVSVKIIYVYEMSTGIKGSSQIIRLLPSNIITVLPDIGRTKVHKRFHAAYRLPPILQAV